MEDSGVLRLGAEPRVVVVGVEHQPLQKRVVAALQNLQVKSCRSRLLSSRWHLRDKGCALRRQCAGLGRAWRRELLFAALLRLPRLCCSGLGDWSNLGRTENSCGFETGLCRAKRVLCCLVVTLLVCRCGLRGEKGTRSLRTKMVP